MLQHLFAHVNIHIYSRRKEMFQLTLFKVISALEAVKLNLFSRLCLYNGGAAIVCDANITTRKTADRITLFSLIL